MTQASESRAVGGNDLGREGLNCASMVGRGGPPWHVGRAEAQRQAERSSSGHRLHCPAGF